MAQKSLDITGNTLNVKCQEPSVTLHTEGLWPCTLSMYKGHSNEDRKEYISYLLQKHSAVTLTFSAATTTFCTSPPTFH